MAFLYNIKNRRLEKTKKKRAKLHTLCWEGLRGIDSDRIDREEQLHDSEVGFSKQSRWSDGKCSPVAMLTTVSGRWRGRTSASWTGTPKFAVENGLSGFVICSQKIFIRVTAILSRGVWLRVELTQNYNPRKHCFVQYIYFLIMYWNYLTIFNKKFYLIYTISHILKNKYLLTI